MDTSDEWIRQRTGIQERRYVSEGQTPGRPRRGRPRGARSRPRGLEPDEIDCIVLATLSPQARLPGHVVLPAGAPRRSRETPCFDLRAQCSGFLFSLATAKSFVASGQFRRVLVVGCEVHSTGLDSRHEGRDVAVLFGDGAGAVRGRGDSTTPTTRARILEVRLHAQGKYAEKLWIEAPGSGFSPTRITEEMLARAPPLPAAWTGSSCSSTP